MSRLDRERTARAVVGGRLNPVADEVSAFTAVVRPILGGTLYALKHEVVGDVGGNDSVRLRLSPVERERIAALSRARESIRAFERDAPELGAAFRRLEDACDD